MTSEVTWEVVQGEVVADGRQVTWENFLWEPSDFRQFDHPNSPTGRLHRNHHMGDPLKERQQHQENRKNARVAEQAVEKRLEDGWRGVAVEGDWYGAEAQKETGETSGLVEVVTMTLW